MNWSSIGQLFFPKFTWRKENSQSDIFLTFDDGPHPTITPWVLQILNEYDAKATFFVVGDNAAKYPHIIQQIKENGHSLGNHTMHHTKGWKTTAKEYISDIEACENVIGKTPLFRPPHGQINFKAKNTILQNYEVIMWDILTEDYLPQLETQKKMNNICKKTISGSIVVFHDSEKAKHNLEILLPQYLAFLQEKNLRSVAL